MRQAITPASQIESVAFGLDEAGWALHHAEQALADGARALSRAHAVAALDTLDRAMRAFLTTPEFQAARAWDLSAEPLGAKPQHSLSLAEEIHRLADAANCAALAASVRQSLVGKLRAFAEGPHRAVELLAAIPGCRAYTAERQPALA